MKIAFLQREWFENIGIMSLASLLMKNGHKVEAFVNSAENNILDAVKKFDPEIVCFSCTTGEHLWALDIAANIKKNTKCFTVFGGHHPTFFPDIIEYPQVDAICRGEGEYPLLELVGHLEKGISPEKINNLYLKNNGSIIKNDVRPLLENLDELPYPAREIYDKYPDFQKNPTKHFIASRGCPFNCSYCYTHTLRKLYDKKGKFVRTRSAESMIRELKEIKSKYVLRTIFFDDDTFIFNTKWLYKFLDLYKEDINIPFICNVQATVVTDETARRLSRAGCFRVSMGLETGNEGLRRTLLNKNILNKQIIEAAKNLKKYGIKILTNNMMCLPGETVDQAFETIYLNIEIKTEFPWCSILQPYPDTLIAEHCIAKGLMKARDHRSFSPTFFKDSPLNQKNINELINLQKFFYLAIKCPGLIPVIKKLIKLPLRRLYDFIFLITFAYRYKTSNRLTVLEIVQFGFRNLPLYLGKTKSKQAPGSGLK